MIPLAYIDGALVALDQAMIPLNDRGFLVGDGMFETMRAVNGRVFERQAHLARLQNGLDALSMDADMEAVGSCIQELVAAAPQGQHVNVRIQVSAGQMDDVAALGTPRISGIVKPLAAYPLATYAGIAMTRSVHRVWSDSPLAGIKTLSFANYVMAKRLAKSSGSDDAYLCNELGHVAEATTSNIFARTGEVMWAPGAESGAVDGITRAWVLRQLERATESPLRPEALAGADEVWLTNTTGGIVPVTKMDGRPIGDGQVGALSRQLQAAYVKAVA